MSLESAGLESLQALLLSKPTDFVGLWMFSYTNRERFKVRFFFAMLPKMRFEISTFYATFSRRPSCFFRDNEIYFSPVFQFQNSGGPKKPKEHESSYFTFPLDIHKMHSSDKMVGIAEWLDHLILAQRVPSSQPHLDLSQSVRREFASPL